MTLPPHAQEWMERAEIDYIGPFVKAWAAFNAWYRTASGEAREREDEIDVQPYVSGEGVEPVGLA